MKWTSEPPKEEGWYWCRRTDNGVKGVLQLGLYPVPPDGSKRPITDDDFREWAGPIEEPEEPEEKIDKEE